MMAVRNDEELNKMLRDVHISHAGVLPSVHRILIHTLEQRRKLQLKGELPKDDVLATQVTESSSQEGEGSQSPKKGPKAPRKSPNKKNAESKKKPVKRKSSVKAKAADTPSKRKKSLSASEETESAKKKLKSK